MNEMKDPAFESDNETFPSYDKLPVVDDIMGHERKGKVDLILNRRHLEKTISLSSSELSHLINEDEKESDEIEIFGIDVTSVDSDEVVIDPASNDTGNDHSPIVSKERSTEISKSSFPHDQEEEDNIRGDGIPLEVPVKVIPDTSQDDFVPTCIPQVPLNRNRPPVEAIHIKRVSSFNTKSTAGESRSSDKSRCSQRSRRKKASRILDQDGLWFKVASGEMPLWESFDAEVPSRSEGFTSLPCVCGRGEICSGLSAAYYMLNDPRAAYSEVPAFWNKIMEKSGISELDGLRDSLDKYINDSGSLSATDYQSQTIFIANHHFHPDLVLQSSERSDRALPMFVTKHEVEKSQLALEEQDRVLDSEGRPTGEYYVVPSYDFEKAKEDMKNILWVRQTEEGHELPSLCGADAEQKRRQESRATSPEPKKTDPGDNRRWFEPSVANQNKPSAVTEGNPRAQVFATLADFETNRESAFSEQLESLSSQWRSAFDQLCQTRYESEHAARLVKQSALHKSLQVFEDRSLAVYVATCMSQQMSLFPEELRKEVDKVRDLGSRIIAELTSAEARVLNAWGSCCKIATVDKSDFWLVEMCYRVSMAYQLLTWKEASSELLALCESAMETRRERCIRMQGLLLEFASQQKRLIDSEDTANLDDADMDKEIDALIQELSDTGRLSSQMEFEMNCSRAREKESSFPLVESPMTSQLLRSAKVVEKKNGDDWHPALAVATADSFLHVFDLPPLSSSNESSSPFSLSPEDAFQKLLPEVRVPTAKSIEWMCRSTDKQLLEHLTPSKSFFLPNVSHQIKRGNEEGCAVTLTQSTTRRSGKVSIRKLSIRTESLSDLEEWLDALSKNQM